MNNLLQWFFTWFLINRYSKSCFISFVIVDRSSYILLWELLILLLRQKSAIDGCDIAELLLKDREDFHKPYASDSPSTMRKNSFGQLKRLSENEDGLSHQNTINNHDNKTFLRRSINKNSIHITSHYSSDTYFRNFMGLCITNISEEKC